MKTTTTTPKVLDNTSRDWYIVDAQGKTLGRLATEIARVINGKHKASFSNHLDQGDYVIVTNADKFKVTGKKMADKMYYRHSGYIGHLRETTMEKQLEKHPESIIEHAVSGMIPKNKLRAERMARLKVYLGTEHPHEAQKPKTLSV